MATQTTISFVKGLQSERCIRESGRNERLRSGVRVRDTKNLPRARFKNVSGYILLLEKFFLIVFRLVIRSPPPKLLAISVSGAGRPATATRVLWGMVEIWIIFGGACRFYLHRNTCMQVFGTVIQKTPFGCNGTAQYSSVISKFAMCTATCICMWSDDHPENGPHAFCCMWAHMQHYACGPFSGWSSDHIQYTGTVLLKYPFWQ